MPRARHTAPGPFTELTLPYAEYWTTRVGARADLVHTNALVGDLRVGTSLPGAPGSLSQDDVLYAFYLDNDVKLTESWSAHFGGGHAQRPPTLSSWASSKAVSVA